MISELSIHLIRTLRRRRRLAVGVASVDVLVERCVLVAAYRRPPSEARVHALVAGFEAGSVDLYPALLLNLRAFDEQRDLVEHGDGNGVLRLHGSLHVIDGQHRVEALCRLLESDPERWGSVDVPIICLLGADEREETEHFFVVHETGRQARTDLALERLCADGAEAPLPDSRPPWRRDAERLAATLAETRPWRGRVRRPHEPRAATTIAAAALATSFRPLLTSPYFGTLELADRTAVLEAYWTAIGRILPEPFARPTRFALQKATGVAALHTLLVPVLEHLRSNGDDVRAPEGYHRILREPLLALEGGTTSGELVTGSAFWRTGPGGGAAAFSGNAGRRVLEAKLRASLP